MVLPLANELCKFESVEELTSQIFRMRMAYM